MSIGGHLTMVKAVLGSMPLYHLSLFRASITIIERLEAIGSLFLCFNDESRKMVWINSNKIIMEKGMGGLGVGSIRAKNLSLLGKWMWRFQTEDTTLWRKVIKEIYGPYEGFIHMAHRGTRIGPWNEIVKSNEYIKKLEIPLDNLIVRKIASGEQTRFWKDKWCSSGRKLMNFYPRLFALENNKDSWVCDRSCLNNGV
nr:RNA-directed DNA polymerase, eukaryota, reverse transcriptase zinc-binding domain protein [Tanacetum cinerariifolium]